MYKTKDYLYQEYIVKNRTESDIAKEWNIDAKLLHYYIKRNGFTGIKSRRKYTVNEKLFNLSNPIFCYYAGLIATDGYIDIKNHRVSLRVKNLGSDVVFENLKNAFQFTGEVKAYRGCNDLTITSDILISKLKLFGITSERKTYTLLFPKLFIKNEDCQRMFFRGLLDGDGNIHSNISSYTGKVVGGEFRIATASESFIDGVIRFLNKKFSFNYSVSYAHTKSGVYPKLEMHVQDSRIFYDWVYEGFEEFRFQDKFNKYQQLKMKR